jgi:Ca2+-binding EF-hand superfamily protein
MNVDAVKGLLCSRGVKADRLTEAEVAQMFDQVKPAGGKFNYGKFTRIMKRGSDE